MDRKMEGHKGGLREETSCRDASATVNICERRKF